jgi:hypothetical protein
VMFLHRYAKLGRFCEVCGLLGHEYEECGNVSILKGHEVGTRLYADPLPIEDVVNLTQ